MSSPPLSSDRSPSSQRSTPSRNLPNCIRRVNGYHRPLRESVNDSPSRQLLEEFGRMLINDDRSFNRSLDEHTAAQQKLHLDALDRALSKHEEVRLSAERTRERVELDLERERRRREEEEKRAIEKARRELEDQKLAEQRRQLEEQKAREEEKRKQDAARKEQEEAKRRAETLKQQEEEERARRAKQEKDEADRKVREDALAKERALQAQKEKEQAAKQSTVPAFQASGVDQPPQPPPQSTQGAGIATQSSATLPDMPQGIFSTTSEREAIHNQYLDLHQRLKQMRAHILEEAKKIPGLKNQLSEWRRAIHKCCGQLSKGNSEETKQSNRRAMLEIMQKLDAAAQVSEPTIDVTQCLVQNQQPPNSNKQGPAALVFLLNHFAKNIVGQFISESAVDAKSADPIGVLAATVFARPQYLFNGQSLIDLLWAKYHKHCPVLFGISGSEKTKQGRQRIGWKMENDAFIREEEHYTRMSGLAAGFAAITLRDFSKSKNSNPAPNRIYWESLARILNTPGPEVQPTHFVIIKAVIDNYVPRIIGTFGGAGIALLRQALITFPNEKGPQDEKGRKLPAVVAVQTMPTILQRDLHFTL